VGKSNQSGKPVIDIGVGAVSLLIAWGVWSGHIKHHIHRRPDPAGTSGDRRSLTSRALLQILVFN
jgi:hypothetical protein